MTASPYVLPLASPDATLARVGGKGASLARLSRAGLPVPPGFHVTTDAYRRFLAANDLHAPLAALAAVPDDPAALDAASAAIRALFESAPIPPDVADAIRAAYAALPAAPAVAVRSSATAEDLPDASFAGQQETYLNIVGADAVLDAVRRCWSSLWTARAMSYRQRNAIPSDDVALAVVVQALVPSEASGILFTANPVSGHRGQVVIDGAWGLGEAIVGGLVTPDHWVVDKATGRILSAEVHDKAVMTVRVAGGSREETTPADRRRQPSLTDEQVRSLAALGARIEAFYGAPQDIEWAVAEGAVYIVQSRPITSLYPQPPLPGDGRLHVYFNANYLQGIVEPITPAGLSFFRDLARAIGKAADVRIVSDSGPSIFNVVAGRVFIDVTNVLRNPRGLALLRGILSVIDPQSGGGVDALLTDGRLSPRPAGPAWAAVWRLRFLRPLIPAVAPRVLALWRAPDAERQRIISHVLDGMADIHDRVASATTLQGRVAVMDSLPALVARYAPRLIPLAASGIALQRLTHILVRRWGGDTTAPLELLRGVLHNPTTMMDLFLWQLARRMAADAPSAAAMRAPTEEVVARYRAGALPPTAQAALGTFLTEYGHRAVREVDLGMPRWADEPGYIVDVLRTYMDISDPALAPDARFREGEAAAEAREAALLRQVGAGPRGWLRRPILKLVRDRMRALIGLREMPKFILVRALSEVRALWEAMGRDLTDLGLIADPADVFFVTGDEIRAVARGNRAPLAERVAARQAEYALEMRRKQAPRLITSEGVELYSSAAAHSGTALQGTGVSPGVYSGVVRVVLDAHGAQLQPGEILVAPSTDPAWTPLFMAAGALVMEAGGVMSHGSVVAREYGIPAVVGVADATRRLSTGQRVTVDGSTGRVILE
ncbi:MAG: PEP/pyruvate-binding domain-containing protein [Anaerolineae bacterium]